MSDQAVVLGVLRAAPGVVFVEPGPRLVMRDEVHDEARAELARRGLPASHPYVGWHTQADGFDGAGALVRPQRVLFGGDRAVVARALADLEPRGFAVLGGRTDGEVFVLHRDAAPARVDPALAEQWRTRLAVLGDELLAPLRDGERALLHEVVAHTGMRDLLAPAVRALRLRRALTDDDLDVACSPGGLEALGSEAPAVVSHALRVGHARSREAASALAARGRADGALLRAWNDPEALRTARAAALGGRDTGVYLDLVEQTGADPVAAAVELAAEVDAAGGDTRAAAAGLVARLGGQRREHALAALRDEQVPPWLRVVVADHWTRTPVTDPADPWPDAVDGARAALGLPPSPGFDPTARAGRDAAVELRETLVDRHLDGLRAALARTDLDEPAVAVLLELLHGAGALRARDLAPLARDWRTRLVVEPDPYTSAAPAVVTYAAALDALGDDTGRQVADVVARDTRAWSLPARLLLRGAWARDRDDDLAAEAELLPLAHGGDTGAGDAAHALCLVRARLRRITPVAAACESIVEAPARPPYVRRGFASAAIALADGGTGLWSHHFRNASVRALDAALRVAGDERLPREARRVVLAVADTSTVLDHPGHARPVAASPADVDRLRALRQAVGALLEAGPAL
ncbi:hypothetical protein ACFFSW_35410 [Saccharothrix longispora]|uniref:HEAT repeat protein n=1 Tax=Saccharothrix longispora TaxID=33920 RepID=A0ABU1PTX4_9PSEU|nr:hypothetical protein [Saccharothrix longispora]MDR6594095.1 hypothetical protein [Saccharothrix longispora]